MRTKVIKSIRHDYATGATVIDGIAGRYWLYHTMRADAIKWYRARTKQVKVTK